MAKFEDNVSPYLTFVEGSAPSSPPASDFKLYFDSSDHLLKWKNSAGTVVTIATGAAGLPDPMTTRGDIIVRNASNVTARLPIGSTGTVLSSDGTDISWQTPAGGGGGLAQSFLGYNTVGGTWTTVTNKRVYCKKFTLASAATILSVDAYLRPSTDNLVGINGAILADNSNAPGVLLAGNGGLDATAMYLSNSSSMPGAGRWFSVAIGAYLAAGDYWAAIQVTPALLDIANDSSGSDQYFTPTFQVVTGAYPTAWAITTSAIKHSIRVNVAT